MISNTVDWNTYKLSDVVDFLDEKRVPLKESERLTKKGVYPYYGASGIIDYVDNYLFEGEFILLGEDGANIITRSTRLAFLAKGRIWVNNHAHVMKAKVGFNNYFICEYLESLNYTKYNTGTAQPKLNKEVCKNIIIKIPPLKEQEKIAEILSTWDSAIEKQEQLIEKKKEFKKGLMQRLLSGEVRFKEFNGKWVKVKLGEKFKERKETGFEDLELLAITTANGVVRRTEIDIKDTSSEDKSKYKRILPGDIGYNTMRMWQGVSGLSRYEGIVSPAYTILKPVENIDSLYMSYLFKTPNVINLFYRYSQGLVSDTLNLKYENFKDIKVKISNNIEEQKKISEVLKTADKEIDLLEKELEALKLQKKGLMQRLLTGEVRVKI